MNTKPNLFIVGAPKCGTTSLYEYLKQHPEIFMPDFKEPHFFGSDLYITFGKRNLEEYLDIFSKYTNEKYMGEASPSYLLSESSAEEIKTFNPKAKIIIALRNPVDMVYSLHSEHLLHGHEFIKDFEKAINNPDRNPHGGKLGEDISYALLYKNYARFTNQIKRYFDQFGRANVHIVIFDDFKKDIHKEYKNILKFLDINKNFTPKFERHNSAKVSKLPIVNRLFTKIPPWLIKTLHFFKIELVTLQKIKFFILSLITKETKRPPMNPELYRQLQSEFKDEIKELSKLLDRDLTFWSKNKSI